MNSRVRIVKRNEASEPKKAPADRQTTELVRNREIGTVVKSWIDEFKLRSRQRSRVTLPMPNKA